MRDRIGRDYSNDWQVINHAALLIKAAGTSVEGLAQLSSFLFYFFKILWNSSSMKYDPSLSDWSCTF